MADLDFEKLVDAHYRALYRFAYSLAQAENEASDLTQQTFYLWASRGHQLRDSTKVKTWLFTTLYREFLGQRRREQRFECLELNAESEELPQVDAISTEKVDATRLMSCLGAMDELHRAPLTLFYLEEHSYREIGEILGVPIGTVMSRLARGKQQLRRLLEAGGNPSPGNIIPIRDENQLSTRQTS